MARGSSRPVSEAVAGSRECVLLADTLAAIDGLPAYLRIATDGDDGWIAVEALGDPDAGPAKALFDRFIATGFGPNRRAAAGSLMLRYGWAAGFAVASYLALNRVPRVGDLAMRFSEMTLLEAIRVRDVSFVGLAGDPLEGAEGWARTVVPAVLREELLAALVAITQPLIERQHDWSRFSRHALWSMAVSSWCAQFTAIGERLGARADALAELRTLLALDPVISRAAPELYEVSDGTTTQVCQNRAACCLYFKSPRRHFCASCPIIPEAERLARNLDWVRARTAREPAVA